MSKDLSTNIDTQITAETQKPINLYIVFLDDYTLYLAGHPQNVNFFSWDTVTDEMSSGAQVYTPIAISHSDIRTSADSKIDNMTVSIDNINNVMSEYISKIEFRGRRLIVLRVYRDYLASYLDYIVLFDGMMDNPVIGETSMQVTLKPRLGTLSLLVPRRLYDVNCNWKFGSTECGYGKVTTGVSGVVVSSGTALTLMATAYIPSSGIYQTNNYWKYGDVKMISAGAITGERRQIVYSSGVKIAFDYAFSSGIVAGNTFDIQRGCDKTHWWCSGLTNLINYGGFDRIPYQMVIKS